MKQIIAQHEQNVIDVTPVDSKPDASASPRPFVK
jgi:hypothetical protein